MNKEKAKLFDNHYKVLPFLYNRWDEKYSEMTTRDDADAYLDEHKISNVADAMELKLPMYKKVVIANTVYMGAEQSNLSPLQVFLVELLYHSLESRHIITYRRLAIIKRLLQYVYKEPETCKFDVVEWATDEYSSVSIGGEKVLQRKYSLFGERLFWQPVYKEKTADYLADKPTGDNLWRMFQNGDVISDTGMTFEEKEQIFHRDVEPLDVDKVIEETQMIINYDFQIGRNNYEIEALIAEIK